MEPRLISRGNAAVGFILADGSFLFNGAAADQPRKCGVVVVIVDIDIDVFNGAAADQPRKYPFIPLLPTQVALLQWSRG